MVVFAVGLASIALLSSGCGDDQSPEEAFCEAGDSLESNIDELKNLDVVAEGTNAVEDQLEAIEDDIEDLRESGREVASDEIDALASAMDDLESALDSIGDEGLTPENSSETVSAINAVASAASAVDSKLGSTCS